VRRERAADYMSIGHDALKPFSAVSILGNVKIRHLGESESLSILAIFHRAIGCGFNKSSQLFMLPLS
jgi:hypothetical protein